MIIFLYGKDTYRSRAHLRKMIEKFKQDRDPQGLNVVRLDAEKETKGAIFEQILAAPFLAERRMVVVENILSTKHKETCGELLERVEANTLPESTVLVIWEAIDTVKAKEPKQLLARLKEEQFSQLFDVLSGQALSAWIQKTAKERNMQLQPKAVQFAALHVGTDTWRLSSLLDQLQAYAPERAITETDVALFIEEKVDDNIFNLVDAVVAKQSKKVFAMIQEQYKRGEDAQYIFAMLLRQFRILLQLRDLYDREDNIQSGALAKRLGLHPFVVKKSLPMVKRYTSADIKYIFEQLLEMDERVKTGFASQQTLVDVFVGKACAA